MLKRYLSYFILLSFTIPANATHIIGGYFEYIHQGGNTYDIHLVVYRDCLNGVPPFDSPAAVGIYESSGTLVTSINLFPNDSTIVFVQGVCIPGNICIKKANYYGTITLPPGSGSYILAYQRCCRSQSVMNLVTPGDFGMTIQCEINPLVPNSSPVFNHEFAAFTFAGDNLSFDASATDTNGDQLVYSLDDAIDGASQLDPVPNPPSPPPYIPVVWQPPYSVSNMIGGTVPLTIDANTGIMTAIPGTVGVFVVSHKIEEYRNGNLINTHRKEFVMAVNPGQYFDASGSVYANNGTQPLDIGKSWLIRLNLLDGTLNAVDTNIVSNGNYLQSQAINGVYLIKGSADSTSSFYANNLPTYYGDVLYWYDATPVFLCSGNVQGVDINQVQGINPGGPGFVGGLISQGANRSAYTLTGLEGITVILVDQSEQPVAYATTDASGNFGIGNLPLGTYKVYIDRLNFMVDNTIAPSITVNAATPVLNNLSFLLHSTYLELAGFLGMDENSSLSNSYSISPNPAGSILQLFPALSLSGSVEYTIYTIYDITGQKLLQGNSTTGTIDISRLTSAIYLLEIKSKHTLQHIRFVKQ